MLLTHMPHTNTTERAVANVVLFSNILIGSTASNIILFHCLHYNMWWQSSGSDSNYIEIETYTHTQIARTHTRMQTWQHCDSVICYWADTDAGNTAYWLIRLNVVSCIGALLIRIRLLLLLVLLLPRSHTHTHTRTHFCFISGRNVCKLSNEHSLHIS